MFLTHHTLKSNAKENLHNIAFANWDMPRVLDDYRFDRMLLVEQQIYLTEVELV